VGTSDRTDAASLYATVQALKKLSMSYRHPVSGAWINLTPDKLFAEYSTLIPLLPSDVQLWGFNLVNQFNDSLSADIQDLLITDPLYIAPPLSTLTSRSRQLAALRSLCVCAVCHHTNIKTQERIMNHTISRRLHSSSLKSVLPIAAVMLAPPPVPASYPASDPHPTYPPSVSAPADDDVSAITGLSPKPVRTFISPAEHTMARINLPPPRTTRPTL
jgi:hypothetical protein